MRILLISSILAAATFMSASCANSANNNEGENAKAPVEVVQQARAQADNAATAPSSKNVGVITLAPGQSLPVAKDKPVVVDFFATWCGPCRSYAPIFDKVADEYAGKAVFVRVDVDQHNDLAYKYGIRSIPTTVVIAPDGSSRQSVGLIDAAQLKALFSDYVK